MTVKEIFKLIVLNDNVSIIDEENFLNSWSGDGKNIPLRYCEREMKGIYTEPLGNCDSGLVITI